MKQNLYKKFALLACSGAALFLCACAAAAPAPTAGTLEKNMLDAPWMTPPPVSESLVADKSMNWSFDFRPYSSESAASLWTDPSMQRDVASGKTSGKSRPTAFAVVCDDRGFAMYVFSVEPDLAANLAAGKDLPGSALEGYISARDADNELIEHYYQFMIDQKDNTIRDFPWMKGDRNFTPMHGQFQPETKILPNGYLTKLYFPWSYFWNKIPFLCQDNRIWRFGINRWCAQSQTWGGIVHEMGRMGYVNWPEFTPERRTKIMKNLLQTGWIRYNGFKKAYAPSSFHENTSPYLKEIPQDIRSYIYIPEYRDFDRDVLNDMVAERDALGAKIADFEKMSLTEQEAFYKENASKLYSFNYDVQEAFRGWLEQKLINGEVAK